MQNLPLVGPALGMTPDMITAKLNKVSAHKGLVSDADQKKVDKEKAFKLAKVSLQDLADEIKTDVDSWRTNPAFTPELSAKMMTDNIVVTKDISSVQPDVTLSQEGNLVRIDYTKSGASGGHIYRQLPGEAKLSFFGRATDGTFVDPTPLAAAGVPELRKYQVVLLDKDTETGLPSKVMMIVLGG